MPVLFALLAALALAAVHVLGGRVHALDAVPRSWVLSAGSGVSVAYVAVHLLPEVAALEEHIGHESVPWLVLLAGLVVFYGLELLARRSSHEQSTIGWTHLGSYAIYNAVVGQLLVETAERGEGLVTLTIAMAVHFLVNDHGLREHHGDLYRRIGRWVVALGVLAGAVLGTLTTASEAVLGVLVALLAGSVVINVFKEELPETRASRWTPFAVAAATYAVLLLV